MSFFKIQCVPKENATLWEQRNVQWMDQNAFVRKISRVSIVTRVRKDILVPHVRVSIR